MMQSSENFYDILFSSSHLEVRFWKYKDLLKTKVPKAFDLEQMDEQDLSDIIRSRLIRKRILVESSKLIKGIRDEPAKLFEQVCFTIQLQFFHNRYPVKKIEQHQIQYAAKGPKHTPNIFMLTTSSE